MAMGLDAWSRDMDPDCLRAKLGMSFQGDGAPHCAFNRLSARYPADLGNCFENSSTPVAEGHFRAEAHRGISEIIVENSQFQFS